MAGGLARSRATGRPIACSTVGATAVERIGAGRGELAGHQGNRGTEPLGCAGGVERGATGHPAPIRGPVFDHVADDHDVRSGPPIAGY